MSIAFLGSEIGRGHPFYSDGLLEALAAVAPGAVSRRTDVFEASRGVSRAAWTAVLASYHLAGRGGLLSGLYHRLRGSVDYNRPSALLRVLGRDLRRWAGDSGVLVVDHPAVVGALGGRPDVWYIHGELVAPPEAIVRKAARIFVPRVETAGEFLRGGVHPEQVLVTGVCVENALVPGAIEQADARRERIRSGKPLTVAFFSSGAEPGAHVRTLAAAAAALGRSPHRAVVFARAGGQLERAVRAATDAAAADAAGTGTAEIVTFRGRGELDRVTAEHYPRFDAVVSPPHERSNWALGLAVPFFLVGPDIGPFAPRNRSMLLRAGVASEIADESAAARLPEHLDDLRARGLLLRMSEMGGGMPVDGFRRAAAMLVAELERRGR